jgi:transcriptional regulator with XRE-family HTH domain
MSEKSIHPLAAARKEQNLTQKQLAELAKVGAITIWRAEQNKPINAESRRRLCAYFGRTSQELGLLSAQHKQEESKRNEGALAPLFENLGIAEETRYGLQYPQEATDEQKERSTSALNSTAFEIVSLSQHAETEDMDKSRRDFLQTLGFAGVVLTVSPQELLSPYPFEELSRALAKSSNIDETVLDEFEIITKSYWRLRTTTASCDLLSGVLGHLRTITKLLQAPQLPTIRRRLCSMASEVGQITGQIYFDLNDYNQARAYYKVSIDAAQEAENTALWAVGLGRMSFLSTYNGHANDAILLLQEAQYLATQRQDTSAIIRCWLAAVEAEAQSSIQKTKDCLITLEKAQLISQGELDEDLYWTGFNHSRLAGYTGVCFVNLRQPKDAQVALNHALTLINPIHIRRRSTILTDIAATYIQLEEIDEACAFASQALTTLMLTKSGSVLRRMRKLRNDLKPWEATRAVKNLDEELIPILASIAY